MAVTVLIDRTFKPDGIQKAYEVIVKLRSLATLQPGYISGQTLVAANNPNRLVVMSTWASVQQWRDWRDGEQGVEQLERLKLLMASPEKVDILMVVV